jgi:hypothetical protein
VRNIDARDRAASPEEAAAIAAALERFMRDTATPLAPPPVARDPWTLAAILEGVRPGLFPSPG